MSLRDQLLKAGVVDKKKVQEVNRDLKKERKETQAQREARAVVESREAAERQAAAQAERERRQAEKAAREAAREAAERQRSVGNLLRAYRLPDKAGPQPFYHWAADRTHIHRLSLPESWAWDLRRGRLAVAWSGEGPEDPQYLVLPRETAERVLLMDPARILFVNPAPPDPDDPSLELCPPPSGPPDLRAHRVDGPRAA